MAIQPIRPITPTATSMPSKAVAPLSGSTAKRPISVTPGIRDHFDRAFKLAPIGVSDAPEPTRPDTHGSKVPALPYAWQSLTKFMPSQTVSFAGKTFSAAYANAATDFTGFYTGLLKDFGPGTLKVYKTSQGDQNLYDYQYKNFLKYGNIEGQYRSSEFKFEDGRWWSTEKSGISDQVKYAKMVEDLTDPILRKYALSDQEANDIYELARYNRLSEEQYKALYRTVSAKKFQNFTLDTNASLSPYIKGLNDGTIVEGVSNHAQFGSVFGDGDPGIRFLKNLPSQIDALKAILSSHPGTQIGFAGQFDALGKLNSALSSTASNLGALIGTVLFALSSFGAASAHTGYWLTNNAGRIIDSYDGPNGISSHGNREGVKAVARETGLSKGKVASILGWLYRYRIIQAMTPILNSYNSVMDKNYYSDVVVPEFKGRQ